MAYASRCLKKQNYTARRYSRGGSSPGKCSVVLQGLLAEPWKNLGKFNLYFHRAFFKFYLHVFPLETTRKCCLNTLVIVPRFSKWMYRWQSLVQPLHWSGGRILTGPLSGRNLSWYSVRTYHWNFQDIFDSSETLKIKETVATLLTQLKMLKRQETIMILLKL